MSRRPVMFLSTLAVAAIGLAACSSDGDGAAAAPPTSETTVTQEVPPPPAAEPPLPEETAPAGDEQPAAGPVLADAPDPGPAPEGAVLPSGSLEDPPQTVAGLTRDESRGL